MRNKHLKHTVSHRNSHKHLETEKENVEDTYSILKVGDKVVAVLVLLQTSKGHLRSGDVLK